MRSFQFLPEDLVDRRVFGFSVRRWIAVLLLVLFFAGIFSPFFDLSRVHGIPSAKLFGQHFYFEFLGSLGGYWAATFCSHRWHRVALFIGIDVLSTFALVTLIG